MLRTFCGEPLRIRNFTLSPICPTLYLPYPTSPLASTSFSWLRIHSTENRICPLRETMNLLTCHLESERLRTKYATARRWEPPVPDNRSKRQPSPSAASRRHPQSWCSARQDPYLHLRLCPRWLP